MGNKSTLYGTYSPLGLGHGFELFHLLLGGSQKATLAKVALDKAITGLGTLSSNPVIVQQCRDNIVWWTGDQQQGTARRVTGGILRLPLTRKMDHGI